MSKDELIPNEDDDSNTVSADVPPFPEERPEEIGPYRILDTIGEGGMGVVYLAEQREPVRRRVALKVIKLGMDTKEVIGRFAAEKQALALMNHPNIAKVYDAGVTESGRPYFVMEHVEGVGIAEYCDRHRLSVKERLGLFTQLCHGVQHAHHNGIIHRDIKPSNVIVSSPEGQTIAKIIDFGVAKATNHRLTEETIYTEIGHAVGTPAYMSPEQAERTAEDIDSRTDIYSLGVLLYELLVGELPIDWGSLEKVAYDEIVRRIREEEPLTPSMRWSRLNKERTVKLAAARRSSHAAFASELRRDLDWITLKAMDKDRNRRYPTASELAADVERYLSGDAVLAGPPSSVYRLKKFVRKNRRSVTAVAAVVLALAGGLVASLMLYSRSERHARDLAVALDDATRQSYVANITAAALNARDGNMAEVTRRLEACPEQLRGWEWHHLDLRRDLSLATFERHDQQVWCLAFAADGKTIASGSKGGTVRLWEVSTGRLAATLKGHEKGVLAVDFSPDGALLASGSFDKTVRLWDVQSARLLATLEGHERHVTCVAFHPDGRRVASGAWDGTVRLWDVETAKSVETRDFDLGGLNDLAFTRDGTRLFAPFVRGNVWVLNAETLDKSTVFSGHETEVRPVAVGATGDRGASGDVDGIVHLWRTDTGEIIHTLKGHDSIVRGLDFSPDGENVVSASDDGTVRIWDAETGEAIGILFGHEGQVRAVQYSPDGDRLASASADGTIRLWDPRTIATSVTLEGHETGKSIWAVDVSSDGRLIVSGGADKTARLWNARSGDLVATLRHHEQPLWFVAFSPDDRLIATAAMDDVVLWSTETMAPVAVLSGSKDEVLAVGFHPDGTLLATGGKTGIVRLWNVDSKSIVSTFTGHESWVRFVAFRPDGQRLASASHDGTVRVWDPGAGKLVSTIPVDDGQVLCLAYSPNGEILATGSEDHSVRLWNGETGEPLATLKGHSHIIHWLDFSPDGKRVVSASHDGTLRFWDLGTYELMGMFESRAGHLSCVQFSPDGSRIIAGTEDGRIEVWETELTSARRLWHGAAARRPAERVVTPLLEEHIVVDAVVSIIEADTSLSPDLRDAAIRLARLRGNRTARDLHGGSWRVVRTEGRSDKRYEGAVRAAAAACTLESQNARYLITLAGAQYRLGRHEHALSTLARANKLGIREEDSDAHALLQIFTAMCHSGLDHPEEASKALSEARKLVRDDSARAMRTLFGEASALLDDSR